MIEVYIGKAGVPESNLHLGFESFRDASDFCDLVKDHYMEEETVLYMAVDSVVEFEELEEVFKDGGECYTEEIDKNAFAEIYKSYRSVDGVGGVLSDTRLHL